MIGQFLLAFREALEAALITAIILAYLARTKRNPLTRYAWYGVYLAVMASLVLGASILVMYGGLSGPTKALFEGVAALIAVFVLSSMIYWMAKKGKELKMEVERRLEAMVTRGATLALTSFTFIVVFREGLETVLFLTPFLVDDFSGTLIGASLGVAASLALAYAIFVAGMKISIRKFFYFTSILLVLLAGGLAGYGTHELIEYSEDTGFELGWIGESAYALDIPENNPLHHKGPIGSILAVMLGYTVKAEWARIIVHLAYLAMVLPLVFWVYRQPVKVERWVRWRNRRHKGTGYGRHGLAHRHRHRYGNTVAIAELKPGQKGKIAFVQGNPKIAQRLADLGLTPETTIRVLKAAPLNGPIEVAVRGSKLAIGREIAENILVYVKGS